MILSKLDTPFDLPQIMGFAVSSQDLQQTREIFKKLIATNQWTELHHVGLLNRKKLNEDVHSYQFSIPSRWLNEIVKKLNHAAEKFEIDLEFKVGEFPSSTVLMRPWVFYALAQMCGGPEALLKSSKKDLEGGLKFIFSNRLNELSRILAKPSQIDIPSYEVSGPFDESINLITIPEWPYEDCPSEEEKESHKISCTIDG